MFLITSRTSRRSVGLIQASARGASGCTASQSVGVAGSHVGLDICKFFFLLVTFLPSVHKLRDESRSSVLICLLVLWVTVVVDRWEVLYFQRHFTFRQVIGVGMLKLIIFRVLLKLQQCCTIKKQRRS